MEKDIDRIQKNPETEIVIRIDDFGGRRGVTIREFVKSEKYSGFTKAGTRIPADKFKIFKAAINSISETELAEPADASPAPTPAPARQQQTFSPAAKPAPIDKKPALKKAAPVQEIEEQEF